MYGDVGGYKFWVRKIIFDKENDLEGKYRKAVSIKTPQNEKFLHMVKVSSQVAFSCRLVAFILKLKSGRMARKPLEMLFMIS